MDHAGQSFVENVLSQLEQIYRLRWLLGILSILFALFFLGDQSAMLLGGLVGLLYFGSNLYFWRYWGRLHRHQKRSFTETRKQINLVIIIQALVDSFLVLLLVHLTGGLGSPVPLLAVLYFGLYAAIMPFNILLMMNVVGILGYIFMLSVYAQNWITPFVPSYFAEADFSPIFASVLQIVFVFAVILGAVLVATVTQTLQAHRARVEQQNEFLNQVNDLYNLDEHHSTPEGLYNALADHVKAILGADHVYITRWDDESLSSFPLTADTPMRASFVGRAPLTRRERSITHSVCMLGQTLILENTACSPYMSPRVATQFPEMVSCVGIPLHGYPDRKFLGALILSWRSQRYFQPNDMDKFRLLAELAARLISRASLYQETVRRAELLEKFTSKVTDLVSDLKRTTLLSSIVESASSLLNAPRAALHLNRASGTGVEMICEYATGLSDSYLAALTKRFNQLMGGQTLKSRDYFVIPDVYQDSRTSPMQDLIAGENFRSYAIFSLPAPEGAIGALSLYWDKPHVISSEEVEVGRLFAERAGVILYNSQIYARLTEEALTDSLTGLPNRRYLDQRLLEEVERAERYGGSFALVMLDLNGFKTINDTFGHPIGDSVLQQVSDILRRALRSSDFLARYGGDEFSVILPETNMEQAAHVAEKLLASLNTTSLHLPNENKRYLSASIGIAIFPLDEIQAVELLNRADQRMYHAKHSGLGSIVVLG